MKEGNENQTQEGAKIASETAAEPVEKEFELSDGRKVKILKSLGKHVMQAQARAGRESKAKGGKPADESFLPILISSRILIDGKQVPIEELENMSSGDYMTIMGPFSEKNL